MTIATWFRSNASLRRRVAELEDRLAFAQQAKANAVLAKFRADLALEEARDCLRESEALIVRLRRQLAPFMRRARDPKTKRFVKGGAR